MTLQAADVALTEAAEARHPYPRWLATAGWAGLAAAVALLLGGGPLIWLTAFVVTAFIDRIGRLLGRWGVPPFFLQIVGGFLATVSTLGLLAVNALPPTTEPSLVIAASITVLLSGLSLMGAVQDVIHGHPVTAAGRAAEIALLSAGLLTGVILGLKAGIWFGFSLDPGELVAADVSRFGISTVAAVAAAALSALASYAPLRSLAAAGLAGGVGWAAYGALTLVGFGPGCRYRSRRRRHRSGQRALRPHHPDRPARDRPVRDHSAAAGAHGVPRLLSARLGEGRGGRPRHHRARAGHRPRPGGRGDARPVHRPASSRTNR